MYKECKTSQSSERQKVFGETLLKMMKKQDFKEITVSALCKEMGVPRKAFYRYFDTKEDVLNALTDEILLGAVLHVESQIELEKFFEYWRNQKDFLDILEKNGLSEKLMERTFSMWLDREQLDMTSGEAMKSSGYIAAMLTLVVMWHHNGMRQSVDEMKGLVLEMFAGNSKSSK